MEVPVLTDPKVAPTDELIASCLGKSTPAYTALFAYNRAGFPDFAERWKFYNDGKRWLLSVSHKKKTLFWLSVFKGSFRVGFFFSGKAAEAIKESGLPKEYKQQYAATAAKTFRSISVTMKRKRDVEVYKTLLALKMSLR